MMDQELVYNELQIPYDGIVHPQSKVVFQSFEEYSRWYIKEDNIYNYNWIGILTHRNNVVNGNLDVEKALIETFESMGIRVIVAFNYVSSENEAKVKNLYHIINQYFSFDSKVIIDGLINFQMISTINKDGENAFKQTVEVFKEISLPIFRPLISYTQDEKSWKENTMGLSKEIAWAFTTPEMVGMIEPIVIGCRDKEGKNLAIKDRVEKFCGRVFNWIRLRNTPSKDKKIAIFIHNAPCSGVEATIGMGAGLEVFESIINILKSLEKEGYYISTIPESGEQLFKLIMDKKAYSDFRWTSTEDIVEAGGALYEMTLNGDNGYNEFYNKLDKSVREDIEEMWGPPPGEGMVYNNNLIITGINLGNVTIMVQPKRGCYGAKCTGEVCKILHDPKCPPPHQYIATYKYLEEILKVNAIISVGTGGSLEYLPGKTNGLSHKCYPDIVIGSMINFYIYNAGIGAEGVAPKRRTYSTIIDYLPSSMEVDIKNYKVANLISEYIEAESVESNQKDILKKELEGLIKGIKGSEEIVNSEKDFIKGIKKLKDYLLQGISNSKIEKLHVLGKRPEDKESISLIKEYIDNSEIGSWFRELFETKEAYDGRLIELISEVISYNEKLSIYDEGIDRDLKLKEEIFQVYKKLELVDNEMRGLMNGLKGKFVEPGLSGMPSGDLKNILPTGRNFYLMDSEKVPTKEAYEVGCNLAENLIEKYIEDEGVFPEKIAMNMVAIDISTTNGEHLSQILYLMGITPIWDKNGRVKGIEAIALEDLKRPRIDLTVRISGVLRDSYPEVIKLIDKGIMLVSALDEPLDMNFIRKNTVKLKEYLKSIGSDENIERRSTIRIFGDKPGAYGAGVNLALKASAWKSEKDLAKIFTQFSAYAYGEDLDGCNAKYEFTQNVRTSDISYGKSVSNRYDVLTSGFSASVQGGFEVVKETLEGKKIKQYHGSTKDKHNVKVAPLSEEIKKNMEETFFNPLWKEHVKSKGYLGATEFMRKIQNIFEWQCLCKNIEDKDLDRVVNLYINDRNMMEWFNANNKYAFEEIARRFLELNEREKWNADKDVLKRLKMTYVNIEGDMEELLENSNGEIQGGSVEILNPDDVESWKEKIREVEDVFK